MNKLSYINVLRAFAVLSVLVVHSTQIGHSIDGIKPYFVSLINNGSHGVQLFYILSAFTLFLSYDNRSKDKEFSNKSFFIRRFFRIAPLYYLAILYYLLQDGFGERYWLGDQKAITIANILSNLTFTHGFSPYWINSVVPGGWSVAIEVVFYCLLPFLFRWITCSSKAFIFLTITIIFRCLLLLILSRLNVQVDGRLWSDYLYLFLPNQLPVFALGILTYFLIKDKSISKLPLSHLICLSAFMMLELSIGKEYFLSKSFYWGAAFCLLLFTMSKMKVSGLKALSFAYIGELSYCIYLSHFALINWINYFHLFDFLPNSYHTGNYILNLSILTALVIILSSILHYAIEKPMMRLGKKLTNLG